MFIQGPPGTGKTTVIVEAIKRRLAANPDERILVTSHSNLAVDNALERLAGTPGMRAVRVARAERVHPTVERFRCDDEDDPRLLEANCYFATCATAATSAITDMNFDIVILDEANKARVDEALPALRLGSALALVGDHKQLPPVEDDALYGIVESDEALETLVNRSLFEQAWEGGLPESARCLLTIQHRMHPDIAAYVSASQLRRPARRTRPRCSSTSTSRARRSRWHCTSSTPRACAAAANVVVRAARCATRPRSASPRRWCACSTSARRAR